MNRFAGLSVLAVTLATAGTLAAQNIEAVSEQAPVATEKPVTQTVEPLKSGEVAITRQAGDTHVRIVRLSQVQGKVGMDRGTGHGIEPSMQNMPIVEGMLLGTADEDSYAEVEFEDGGTLRLGPATIVKFSQLVSRATGAKATTVRVDKGTVYVSRENTKADEFTLVMAGTKKIAVSPSTHLRLELEGTKAAIAVFSGNVAVDGSGTATAPVMVGKKQTLSVDIADSNSQVELAKKVEEGPFDSWDQDAQKYHERYAKANSLVSGGGYGVSDLNYYGSFSNVPGYGMMWQPYFVGSGWNPYANGLWALYPGGSYSWVSPYPWGWLPFHQGTWVYSPSYGWGWQPGGAWRGVNNVAGTPVHGTPAQMPGGILPKPPADARNSLVQANSQPLVYSKQDSAQNFVFRKDSAGLGVPRGSLGKLGGVSNDVAQHGFVNRHVYVAPAGESSHWTDGSVYRGPLALHRGSPTDEAREAMWARHEQAAGAAANSLQANHGDGLARAGQNPGDHRGFQQGGQSPSAGWQGRQGQNNNANNANGMGWKGQQGANASANSSGHSWNGNSGAQAGGHSWNGGGGNPGTGAGAAASGGGHTWAGGGGGGAASHGGGGSMSAGGGGGHAGGGGGGNAGGGGAAASGGGSHK